MEKLIYVSWAAVLAIVSLVGGLFWLTYETGKRGGEAEVRTQAAEAADHCEYMVELGFKDLQTAALLPVTHQINCRPMRNIATGKDWRAQYGAGAR